MQPKPPVDVARRCLCLELCALRLGLELDTEAPVGDRERARAAWVGRVGDLGLEPALLPEESALLGKEVGTLTEDELDELDARASGAVVLLWALGRLAERPTFATVGALEEVLEEHGLLGDGSIPAARAAAEAASLRTEAELDAALSAYVKTRGKAREAVEPEKIVAEMAVDLLEWALGIE